MEQQTIIIVGGGIAGLAAAHKLSGKYNIILLEGSSRLGGRIYSDGGSAIDGIIERGAEFIHSGAEYTKQLLKQAGINYEGMQGSMYRREDGALKKEDEMAEHWDTMMDKMKEIEQDISLSTFLSNYFPSDEYAGLRAQAKGYAAGFDLAGPDKASVKALYNEWSEEQGEMYHIPQGYSALIRFLTDECKNVGCSIVMNAKVTTVNWQQGNVTAVCEDGTTYHGSKIIVTISVSLLQKQAIQCTPALPQYAEAANNIGYGQVIKALLQFKEPLLHKDIGFVLSRETFPTWWTWEATDKPIWTGWLGGPNAAALAQLSNEELAEQAIASFAAITGVAPGIIREKLHAVEIVNWQNNPWSLGGYSYYYPESHTAKKLLGTPVDDTIYFAGEGIYDGPHSGTVEAAISSAMDVVKAII